MNNEFEIIVRSRRPNFSLAQTPARDNSIADGQIQYRRGLAFMEDPTNPDKAILADGTISIAGFVTRDIAAGGPQLESSIYPGKIELPTVAGDEASFEDGEVVEAEGDYICGTGSRGLDNTTEPGTELSFDNGRFCKATTGQISEWVLVASNLTVVNEDNDCRIRARRKHGSVK